MNYKSKILSFLLNKYEKSKSFLTSENSTQRPQFSFQQNHELAQAYNDEMDYTKREGINEALKELEKMGLIEVKWKKWEENRIADKVYLQFHMISNAYIEAGIDPKGEKIKAILKVLQPLSNHSWTWVQEWFNDVNQMLASNKTAGINLDDINGYQFYVTALTKLEGLDENIPKRIFSQLVFGNTKLFENEVQSRILSIYKKYGEVEFDTNEEYLESIGLIENIRPVLFKGNMDIRIGEDIISLRSFIDGIGLMNESVRNLEIVEISNSRVLLIENMATYYTLLNQNDLDALLIYTGGFPQKNIQQFFSKLSTYLNKNGIEISHSGDLDYGGIQIFEYMKRNFFPKLKPYKMDISTYKKNLMYGHSFDNDYERKLKKILENIHYISWHDLIKEMLIHKKRVEQEVIIY